VSKHRHFRLTLDVEIDPQGETVHDLTRRMHQVVRDAVNNGTLTVDSPATVENYRYSVDYCAYHMTSWPVHPKGRS
jgi:hypothetical protein